MKVAGDAAFSFLNPKAYKTKKLQFPEAFRGADGTRTRDPRRDRPIF